MKPQNILRLFLFAFPILSLAEAAEPYEPIVEKSVEELWRWQELEALEGFGARIAAEAPDGAIWFARRNTVLRYDGRSTERFQLDGIPSDAKVKDLHVCKNGQVFLFTDRSLWVRSGGEWQLLSSEESPWYTLNYISESQNGDVWVAINDGLLRIREGVADRIGLDLGSVGATAVDSEGRLWVSHSSSGKVVVFDVRDGALELFREYGLGIENEQFGNLYFDSDGRMWFILPGVGGGLYVFEDYELQSEEAHLADGGMNYLSRSIAEVPRGTMWFIGSRRLGEYRNGKLKVLGVEDLPLPTSYPFATRLSGDRLLIGGVASKTFIVDLSDEHWMTLRDLNFQCEGESGTYWFIHHDRRVVRWQREEDRWEALDVEDGMPESPNRIFASSDGVVWVSGHHKRDAAVSYFENGVWSRETFPDVGSIISHLGVTEAEDGSVLFGSGSVPGAIGGRKGGAVVFRREDGRMVGTQVSPPIFPGRIANIVERKNDGFWFGAASLAHRLGNGSLYPERIERFEDSWIDDLAIDSENNLWAALWGSGVYRYNGDIWEEFGESNGIGSDRVVCLLTDRSLPGIWVGTDKGLSRFDGSSWTNWYLPKDLAFFRENNTLRGSGDGALWLNYSYRSWLVEGHLDSRYADRYRTVRYTADRLAPETSIVSFDREVPEGGQIGFTWEGKDAWSKTGSDALQYSWKLNGGDWSVFSPEKKVVISGLKGGAHSFEVRARDIDWNLDASAARAEFRVILPLWKRGWFILTMIATLGLIAYLTRALFKSRLQAALAMEKFKLEFFTNISHELRNPLAVIVGPLESLLARERNGDDRGLLRIALRNARKMQGLVDQLLQFRKLEIGGARIRLSRGEIVGFVKDAVEAEAPLWKRKNQNVLVVTRPEYLECEYDADKLQKIVDNLLSNAIKYTQEGGRIEVGFSAEEEGGELQGTLWVEDSGKGIPAHEIDLVTKPFYRVNGSLEGEKGFGIGLALVGQLVSLWGGELLIESPPFEKDVGTRVTAKLPLAKSKESYSVSEVELSGAVVQGEERRMQVLLVEDSEDLRSFMRGELSSRFDILEAANGREGLEVAIRENPDLIVSDVMMPEMDGFELCAQIRSNTETSHIPIVLLTAKSAEEHSVDGIKAGADAYFAKPLNMDRLRARIDQLLTTRQQLKDRFAKQLVVEPTELTVSSTEEAILRKAIEVVERSMADEGFDVERFAREMGMSRTTLYRKLKALTGKGPNPFIRCMRLKRAAQLLSGGKLTVSETLEHVGILDLSYFSRVFKSEFGMSPSDYLDRGRRKQEREEVGG
ncbi:response regulator [Pelagicoccus sp. SDUM812005]|uniref:response regulator n=1 Tax=Pelagicoccus sp. SDUM812005 TaxID=3041257 RepID=UPI00280F7F7C|nr:response regulator [Pelagicoccus sp. SDUM812005]MDQ8183785.1 response regulator [Pelagicoccus sp. SDUM812005]